MELINNESEKQYEFHLESGTTAFVEYVTEGGKVYLTHTQVPESSTGKGIGSELIKQALTDIRKQGKTLVPLCAFVSWYVNNHDEWHSLLSEGYQM